MAKDNEKIIVQLASPERKFLRVYHDFLSNSFLSTEEQMIFIVLKSFIDFKDDGGEVYPSMETICKMAKMGEKRARKNIKSLEKKGIVKKVRRGLSKTNVYIISDYPAMWACDNVKDIATIANNQGIKPMTAAEHIAELELMGYKVEIKEKGLETEPTKAQNQAPNKNIANIDKNNTNKSKSQDLERYTITDIKMLYEYDNLIIQYPTKQKDIDVVFDILYDTLNSTKQTIRIGSEDKPIMVVIGKLMKLQPDDLIYSINKFHEQTDRIKNVKSYLLTILYNSQEQNHLDIMNLGHYNGDF